MSQINVHLEENVQPQHTSLSNGITFMAAEMLIKEMQMAVPRLSWPQAPLAAEAQVQSHNGPCWICGG